MSGIMNVLLGGGSSNGTSYSINNSLRLRASASAYLTRTPASASNRKTWTFSAWVKRGTLNADQSLFSCRPVGSSTPYGELGFNVSTDIFAWNSDSGNALYTTAVYRDPSSWYHIVFAVDTTQATAVNRLKLYVNGVQVTDLSVANYPTLNEDLAQNTAQPHWIGCFTNGIGSILSFFDGYIAEVNFIDGQALAPTSFGQFSSTTGSWNPISYAGSYGTNGFYLDFSNTTSPTTLGYDKSVNGNNWTPNNISTTAGVTYDAMTDTPTNNYPVLNPLPYDNVGGSTGLNLHSGNLGISAVTVGGTNTVSTFAVPTSGKWYFEGISTTYNASQIVGWFGVCNVDGSNATANFSGLISRISAGNGYYQSGVLVNAGSFGNLNDVISVAVDRTSLPGTVAIRINNAALYTVNAPTGDIFFLFQQYTNGIGSVNFGQQPFVYSPPSGFVALCTSNMTAPTISNGANYFAATTYTGTGATQNITNTVNNESFKPDFVWIKSRNSAAYNPRLFDSIRGVDVNMQSSTTNGDTSEANSLTAFASNGYSVGVDAVGGGVNTNAITYVGWQWFGSNTTASNTNGSITSTVCVNTTSGFSAVAYTTAASGAFTVGHGLGVAPSFIINKIRNIANNWYCYHVSLGNNTEIVLNTTAVATSAGGDWNSTTPTSTVFSMGTGWQGSYSMVSYCWAAIAGYSSFGSYNSNNSIDGPFIYCGFRPRFIMIKASAGVTSNWAMLDTTRDTYNAAGLRLNANTADAEIDERPVLDILSNGFKIRVTPGNDNYNATGAASYIYAAFAENPFQYANAR